MFRKLSKALALVVSILMLVSVMSACGGQSGNKNQETTIAKDTTAVETKTAAETDWSTYKDSSDVPSWTGKQLTITRWDAFGTGNTGKKEAATDDVVTPELTRVTGVTIDKDKYFDNNGETTSTVLAKLVASNTLPSIAFNPDRDVVKEMAKEGLIYDLTDYYAKYCGDILKYAPKDKLPGLYDNTWVSGAQTGKIYAAPFSFQPKWMLEADSTIDPQKWSIYPGAAPRDPSPHFYLRDDIIKKLFPNAKSRDELEQIYAKNGKFTKDELLDIPINSEEDFIKMLYDIKALGLKEGNKEVYPFFLTEGSHDYWGLMNCFLNGLYGWNPDGMTGPDNNYYTFWNKKTQQVDYFYRQPIFKKAVTQMNKLVRDGIVPKESFIDNNENWKAKMNNGLYAVTYAWFLPDEQAMKKANLNFRYRKVYVNIPQDTETFSYTKGSPDDGMQCFVIFKDSVKEEDVPQIMKYFDYLTTEAGQKLLYWGPKSAGLFDEANGERTFKDKELGKACVDNVDNGENSKYGLLSAQPWTNVTQWPRLFQVASKYAPAYEAAGKVIEPSKAQDNFLLGTVDPFKAEVNGQGANFWSFSAFSPDITKFSNAKMEHEKALESCFIASSDAEFNKAYDAYVAKAKQLGLKEEILPDLTKIYTEQINKDYMQFMN